VSFSAVIGGFGGFLLWGERDCVELAGSAGWVKRAGPAG